jgi:hypothetical protein
MTEPDCSDCGYSPPVSELLTFGDCSWIRGWPDYLALGLGPQHIPDLIRMALDEELHLADPNGLGVWSPVHAWRALGQLRAETAVEPLTGLLARIDEYGDDWVGEDLPRAFAAIGPAAAPVLSEYLADPSHGRWACAAAAESLKQIGKQHPETRGECVVVLAERLAQSAELDPVLNGLIISDLIDLEAVEAVVVMERAFAADRVDLSITGDWQDVQIALGLLEERQTPRPDLHWGLSPRTQEAAQQRQAERRKSDERKKRRKQQRRARKKQRKRK